MLSLRADAMQSGSFAFCVVKSGNRETFRKNLGVSRTDAAGNLKLLDLNQPLSNGVPNQASQVVNSEPMHDVRAMRFGGFGADG